MTTNKPVFDQRGQTVKYQFNAAGNINFGSIQDKSEVVNELRKLLDEISKANTAGVINQETAIDIEANVKKVIVQAEKNEPDKSIMLDHLEQAKLLLDGLISATSLVTALIQAAEIVRKFF